VRGYPIGVKRLAGLTAATLAATYHQSHRRAVEAARKRGVVVAPAEGVGDYLEFCDLLDETMEHAGTATKFSKDLIVDGGRALVREGLGDLLLARVDGLPVAGVFVLHAARSSCYWLGASAKDEKALRHRPMNAVFHRAFVDAIAAGRAWFELGGLVTEGLRTFKTRWGIEEMEQPTFERSYRDLAEPLRAARVRLAARFAARSGAAGSSAGDSSAADGDAAGSSPAAGGAVKP
jgi:lipid II:glycine glycyltransferase (peptidoglycan interpeptide bridge formation enzyme)